jgi:hypothetical protein
MLAISGSISADILIAVRKLFVYVSCILGGAVIDIDLEK